MKDVGGCRGGYEGIRRIVYTEDVLYVGSVVRLILKLFCGTGVYCWRCLRLLEMSTMKKVPHTVPLAIHITGQPHAGDAEPIK